MPFSLKSGWYQSGSSLFSKPSHAAFHFHNRSSWSCGHYSSDSIFLLQSSWIINICLKSAGIAKSDWSNVVLKTLTAPPEAKKIFLYVLHLFWAFEHIFFWLPKYNQGSYPCIISSKQCHKLFCQFMFFFYPGVRSRREVEIFAKKMYVHDKIIYR